MPKKLSKNCKAVKKDKKLKEGYLGQTLQDFLDVCIDEYIIDKIYVYGTDDIVYEGPMDDLPDDMRDAEFLEFEAYSNGRDMVTINVDSTEEYGLDTYYTTLEDFLDDCNNENIIIFDLGSEEEIFRGDKYDIPDEVKDLIFVSFDSPNELSVNLSDYEGESDDYDEDEDDEEFDEALKENEKPFYRVVKDPKGKGYCILKRVNKWDKSNTFINDHSKEVFNTPEEAKAMLDKVDDLHFYIDENLKEALGKIQEVTKAVDCDGNEFHVKPIWKTDRLATLVDKDGKQTKVEIADLRQTYDLYDQDDEVISRYEDYLDEGLDDYANKWEKKAREQARGTTTTTKYYVDGYFDNKYQGLANSEVFDDSDKAMEYVWELLQKGNYVKVNGNHQLAPDDVKEFEDIPVDWFMESLSESTIPVKDLLVKTDNKYGITLDHAIDDIKRSKGYNDSLLGDNYTIDLLMKRFGLEHRDVIRALNYKFDGKVLDESVEDDMEKLPHVVMAFKDGGVNRLELEWRPSTKKAHSDYVDLSQAIKNKFGDADIKVKKQEWRDGNKETRYVLEVTLKDNDIKEDVNQLAKKMGAKLLPPKDYGVKKKRPRYVYEVYYFDTEDCRGDAIYRKFSSRKAQEEWYEKHKDDPDKFGMYAFDDATVYENLDEAYNTEDRIKELKEIKKTRALTDDELEELAYCENEVSSREAEKNYLNGESLDENWVRHYRGFDYYEDENEPKYIIVKRVDGKVVDKFVIDATTSQEVKDYIDTNLIKKGAKKKITEAPDDLGFLTDEEIEEQERQEFEKKLAQRKAARDTAKKAEQDRLAQEQAKEKAKQDAIAKGKELYNKVKDLPFEDWFEYLVPSSGKASTVAGELVRAINRVIYRDWNDGDLFYQGYGRETCGAPAVYILYNVEDASSTLYDLVGKEDEAYTEGIEKVGEIIHKYLLDNPDLFGQENEDDCLDSKKFDVDVEFEEPRDYEYTIHLEDYVNDDLEICLADFVNNGDVDAFEVIDRIEDDANAECNTYDEIHCDTPWSYSATEYTINGLTKDQYDTLRNYMEHSNYFDSYIEELYKEYGDPNDPQMDEVDESVNKNWDTIEFNYDKLPITRLNPDTLGREPMEINYTHKVSQDDVEDALFNILEDRGELDDLSLEAGVNYVMNNFDELVNKYEDELKELFRGGAITTAENGDFEESLEEDTVKQGNKWVNKGDTGETHGEFKTKKEADKQRKAMFVNKKPNTKWGK